MLFLCRKSRWTAKSLEAVSHVFCHEKLLLQYKHLVVRYCYLFFLKKKSGRLCEYLLCSTTCRKYEEYCRTLSVVKLRVYVNVVIWCLGFVLGERVKKWRLWAVMLVEGLNWYINLFVHHCRWCWTCAGDISC